MVIFHVAVRTGEYIWYLKPTTTAQSQSGSHHWPPGETTPYNYHPIRHPRVPTLSYTLRHERRVNTTFGFWRDSFFFSTLHLSTFLLLRPQDHSLFSCVSVYVFTDVVSCRTPLTQPGIKICWKFNLQVTNELNLICKSWMV